MDIVADLSKADPPRLLEPRNFKSFKVVVRGRDREAARRALTPIGRWLDDDPDHVAISVAAVRSLAGDEAETADWEEGFSGMLRYAESKGWMVGDAIKAHVEWQT